MATYAKILNDTSGNQILPYTRSKLVYMDDGSTVEDKISDIQNQGGYTLPTASSSTLGGVKIGSNISVSGGTISVPNGSYYTKGALSVGNNLTVSNGSISLTSSNIINALGYTPSSGSTSITSTDIINALGYTPSNMTPEYYTWDLNNVNTSINGSKFSITNASNYFTSAYMHITMYSRQIAFCTLFLTPKSDITAYTFSGGIGLILNFSSHGNGSMRKQFPISTNSNNLGTFPKQVGYLNCQCNSGGSYMTISTSFSTAISAGTMLFSAFTLYPF